MLVERPERFLRCWSCAGGGWLLACTNCETGETVDGGECDSCFEGFLDVIDVGVAPGSPAPPDAVACPRCGGTGSADLSATMRRIVRGLASVSEVLVPEGWTINLGEEDCGTCLRAVADGAPGPFVGFYSQHSEDQRGTSLDLWLRTGDDENYRFRELAFDAGLLLGDQHRTGSFSHVSVTAPPERAATVGAGWVLPRAHLPAPYDAMLLSDRRVDGRPPRRRHRHPGLRAHRRLELAAV